MHGSVFKGGSIFERLLECMHIAITSVSSTVFGCSMVSLSVKLAKDDICCILSLGVEQKSGLQLS